MDERVEKILLDRNVYIRTHPGIKSEWEQFAWEEAESWTVTLIGRDFFADMTNYEENVETFELPYFLGRSYNRPPNLEEVIYSMIGDIALCAVEVTGGYEMSELELAYNARDIGLLDVSEVHDLFERILTGVDGLKRVLGEKGFYTLLKLYRDKDWQEE